MMEGVKPHTPRFFLAMKTTLKVIAVLLALSLLVASGIAVWYLHSKQPVREGNIRLKNLKGMVTVIYDQRGVPHIRAQNESDMYRALGYLHAQDRLFQMELLRRLARGELAEVFGPDMLESDKLFRTLGLRARADQYVANTDRNSPAYQALLAYLDGINHYIANRKPPLEFDALGIPKRAFSPQDTFAIMGYMAYASAAAFKTEPALTYVRDKLGAQYLKVFDIDWHPEGVLQTDEQDTAQLDWNALNRLAHASDKALNAAGIPMFEGSNGWVIAGNLSASGLPLLAGDPHHRFAAPSIWYEAHISNPNFELYGHFQALNPMAMLGHNHDFGWTTTMFQNDDVDLVAETINPENPNQVLYQGVWTDLQSRVETINVKDAEPVKLVLRTSPHGPIVTDAFSDQLGKAPVSMWWTFLQSDNPLLQAFYELNRADTRAKARAAASKIEAPGINILWANHNGDIGWWAAAKLPQRPDGVNPAFILDAAKGEAEKPGYYFFGFNPQEENPQRGYILSANQQPQPPSGVPVPGYYNPPDRARALNAILAEPARQWNGKDMEALQQLNSNDYAQQLFRHLLPVLRSVITDPDELAFLQPFEKWQGDYSADIITPTLFTQFVFELAHEAMADEMGEAQFKHLLQTRLMEGALLNLVQDPQSPWWNNVNTPTTENHFETTRIAWSNAMAHLRNMHGSSLLEWRWGKNHTLTHQHPLGTQKYWGWMLNVGPFAVPGGRETPNQMAYDMGKAPWPVTLGPSTRRIIDFAAPEKALSVNPLGQSGVPFDRHYEDQAGLFAASMYAPMWLDEADIAKNTESTLTIHPSR